MRSSPLLIATLLLLGGAHCAEGPTSPNAIREHVIRPSEANGVINSFDEPHYIWVPASPPSAERRMMMLLLAGTGGKPANAQLIGHLAALQGYTVVALSYPDDLAVVEACASDPAPDCMALMREEIILGTSVSPHVTVDPPNSISGRLRDVVQLLASRFPEEGWSQFLDNGELRWSAIAVGGLSQGGGHAAYIAKIRSVPRVVMFGAPADGYNGATAPWMTLGATPATNYYGFRHLRDPFTSITPNWIALGLDQFGAAVRVEDADASFGGSHMLLTDRLPATGTYADAHPSVYGDVATPKSSNGTPVFESAWRYLLGVP
jgi:hypothetical protein